ncbi:S8 family peptidase [Phytomonospora endophytica]|uniref:Subtilisin family serine protease n=1 Tax=Phytomonospora endophytica TaxID=714109 RepID=A0A841FIQ4_9ACTN|nr:S8 family serine peptidase [Phytomonospora endophytica]MBB6034833.1 subtilisin family serine protease [Phytomonospora endophytica]GIG68963.1 serine protease [Phytomonospora endophytica]
MRIRRALILAGAAALLLSGVPANAGPPPDPTAPPAGAFARPRVLTLVTGDKVRMNSPDAFVYEPAEGREDVGYGTRTVWNGDDRDVHVVPADAAALVAAGRLDERLFNVSGLLRDGLADTGLPLIVQYGDGSPRGSFSADVSRDLPAIDARALSVSAGRAAAMWEDITGGSPRAFGAGVTRVWLDGRARVALDVSVPQVGAPAAWEAGFDGEGVTVAVLDTGYDATHPDLAGRVAGVRDFTGTSPEAIDGYGHGTHVASTVAGSGAASDGRFKGVAPGSGLLIGKVCGDDGYCADSDVIAGMQWAADEGATAVNLSLGGDPTDGTDPLSLAVDALSADTGTLFVVAAGNHGTTEAVGAPASADSALAVGSVTKTDALSDFSSQGPRMGDHAVKPDIAAPGSAITAARAAGTAGEGPYVTADGTSMATPHVTGAAAILKQRHPDWTGARLKAALMSASAGLDGPGAFAIGAGRLDVARAVAQEVFADGNASFPMSAYPHDGGPVTRTVAYTNTSAVDVTLDLAVTGPVEGLFGVEETSVVVPAGGHAEVVVTADPGGKPDGAYGGALVAGAGGTVVRTALGIYLEPELYDLTLDAEPRAGTIDHLYAAVFDVDTYESFEIAEWDADGDATIRIPAARYAVYGGIMEGGDEPSQTSFSGDVVLSGDRTVSWAAAGGTLNGVDLDHDDAVTWSVTDVLVAADPASSTGHNVTLTPPVGAKSYSVAGDMPGPNSWYLRDERLVSPEGATEEYSYDLTFPVRGRVPEGSVRRVTDAALAAVDTRYSAQGAAAAGWRVDFWAGIERGIWWAQNRRQAVPGERTEYFTPGRWNSYLGIGDDSGGEPSERRVELVAGRAARTWNSAPLNVGLDPVYAAFVHEGDRAFLRVGMFDAVEREHFTDSGGGERYLGTTVILADGVEIRRETESVCNAFGVPLPDAFDGTVTVTCDAVREVAWATIGTAASAEWNFAVRPGETVPAMSAVRLDASGVVDGYADARLPQIVALEVYEQAGAAEVSTKSLTFEVSYDEGKTWRKVGVRRGGDHAVALLRHPAGATSVSTRLSAADEAGNTVTQTMIRSYGLR